MVGFFSEIQNAELSIPASFLVYQERSRRMQKEEETAYSFEGFIVSCDLLWTCSFIVPTHHTGQTSLHLV